MHTILGAGGPIANALQKILIENGKKVNLVSRRPISTVEDTTWHKADLTNYSEFLAAAKISEVMYLCAGLIYDTQVWQQQWPVIINNAINVAKETGVRLIFFDNVYMYGRVNGPMLETTPYNPCSKKGEIRAKIAEQLMAEAKLGNIRASIARAPDFYGAKTLNSFFDMMVLSKLAKKKSAQWLGNADALHSFILIEDAAKAVALLGENEQSDNEIWHLPTSPALRGRQFIELAAEAFDRKPNFAQINKFMLRCVGLFNPIVRNSIEMYYQYQHDYQFNSDKFQSVFNAKPTPYREGFEMLAKRY
jgi:nucleoside-diphosphate-sugar epimerase